MNTKAKNRIFLFIRIIIAVILVQTLRFKFTAHPDSVYIFETVGIEPFGRIAIGVFELIAAILLLIPRTAWIGAILTAGVIGGAVFMHLTILGIDIKGDGGILFYTAVFMLVLSLITIWNKRLEIPILGEIIALKE